MDMRGNTGGHDPERRRPDVGQDDAPKGIQQRRFSSAAPGGPAGSRAAGETENHPEELPNRRRREERAAPNSAHCATRISNVTKVTDSGRRASVQSGSVNRRAPHKKRGTESGNTVVGIIKCISYITVVFVIAAIISTIVIFVANDMYAFVKSDEAIEIEIPEDASVSDIAEILNDNGIIKYKGIFKMYAGRKDDGQGFSAGKYTVSPMSSYSDLLSKFKTRKASGVSTITIPEGYTTDEIIDLFVEKGIGQKENYIDVINNYDFDYWFIDELGDDWASEGRFYRLDGYLFPDTYQFYNSSSEATVINKFLARFKAVFTQRYRTRAEELGYSVDEVLIIASMIEKEAGSQADFSNISSVFHNRLKNSAQFPYLNSDATVMYAIQHATGARPNLSSDDMNYDSPYNSYTHPGLVPGPIANPSNSAILAALNPPETSYYFFVSSDTKTFFSTTKEEHDMYVYQIAQEREALAETAGN